MRKVVAIGLTVGAVLWAGCGVPAPQRPTMRLSLPQVIKVRTGGRVVDVPLEEYVLGSVLAEIVPSGETPETVGRIFEVQAVLARSFVASHLGRHRAEGFDVCDGTHCQVYAPNRIRTSSLAFAARVAVERTAGLLIMYGHRPAEALFHADCGGRTAAVEDVWGGAAVPYLASAPDDVPAGTHRAWRVSIPTEQLRVVLNSDERSRVGRRLTQLAIPKRDASGRAMDVELDGDQPRELRGEELRAIVNQRLGDRTLQSTRFTVHETDGAFVFEGTGYGHGVGLCQLGALARARQGASLDAIVQAYFKGATIARLAP